MNTIYAIFIRCVIALVFCLPLAGCGRDLPLPEGVNREAKPQIIVKQGDIFVDNKIVNVRKSKLEDWMTALGPSNFENDVYRHWNSMGLTLRAFERDEKFYITTFRIFLRRDADWDLNNLSEHSSFKHARPTGTFKGYLEIDGIPIGPNMTREELNRWRKKLDLEPLRVDRDLGHYYVYEAGRWTQQYYFDGDGPLIYIEFL